MPKGTWSQELMWVKRDAAGQLIAISEKLPDGAVVGDRRLSFEAEYTRYISLYAEYLDDDTTDKQREQLQVEMKEIENRIAGGASK